MEYAYEKLGTSWPYDWSPAKKGHRPWDQLDFHLDLGCGRVPKGRLGIDKRFSEGKTDLVIDLNNLLPVDEDCLPTMRGSTAEHYKELPGAHGTVQPCLPFPDESIESIITHHAFEHIGLGFEHLMEECYRVLKWDGVMRIIVPLFPSAAAVMDYDHKRYFMEGTLMGFCQEPTVSHTDGFAERYNTCNFRMIDEDVSPITPQVNQWRHDRDARELRTTLWKAPPGASEIPAPRLFMPVDQPTVEELPIAESLPARDPTRITAADALRRHKATTEPFASVCVLSYERLELLKECIETMCSQAESPFELIVHDDGSEDEELRNWLFTKSQEGAISTLLMNAPGWNEGQGIAMNRMAAVAKGDPIIKCDQDLVFSPGWLRKLVAILDENWMSTAEIEEPVIGALGVFKYLHPPVVHTEMHIKKWPTFDQVQDFVGSFLAMPRAAWVTFGPWDERSPAFAEDVMFKQAVRESEGWCLALTKEDLAHNQGFGIGPSTVVIAEGTVREIRTHTKLYGETAKPVPVDDEQDT